MENSDTELKVLLDIMDKNHQSDKEIAKAITKQTAEIKDMNKKVDKLCNRGIFAIFSKFFSSDPGQKTMMYIIVVFLALLVVMKGFDISFANLLAISQPKDEQQMEQTLTKEELFYLKQNYISHESEVENLNDEPL